MGLDAQVIAIGPFSQAIAGSTEYGPELYEGVAEGTTIVTNVFIGGHSSASHFLAKCFGVGAWEVGKHELNPELADIESLLASDFAEDVPKFIEFRDAGFKFYYLPNG